MLWQEGSHSSWPQSDRPRSERDTEDVRTIPYEGRHVLEIMGVKTTDSEADIEAFLTAIIDFALKPLIK